MLDTIRELRESIPPEQREVIAKILAEDEMAILGTLLSSTRDEKKANEALGRFKEVMYTNPGKAVRLWTKLDDRQRKLIQELTEDDD